MSLYAYAAGPFSELEGVAAVAFDGAEDLLWGLGDAGGAATFHADESLAPHARCRAFSDHQHGAPVALLPLGGAALVVASDALRALTAGAVGVLTHREEGWGALCAALDAHPTTPRCVVGHQEPVLTTFDVSRGQVLSRTEVSAGTAAVRCNGRLVVTGSLTGEVTLRDPRRGLRAESTVAAHAGTVTTLDAKGELLATCGVQTRFGRQSLDPLVKVFDIRQTARTLTHIHFSGGPSLLRFSPKFSSLLLVASQSGVFMEQDVNSPAGTASASYAVDTAGCALTSADISASGEMVAFGDTGGYMHIWSNVDEPRVNLMSMPSETPLPRPNVAACVEHAPIPPSQPYGDGMPALSDFDVATNVRVGLPPRKVEPSLLQGIRQVDFVGYAANPKYRRGLEPGDARKQSAGMRNKRVERKQDPYAEARRQRRERMAAAPTPLPKRYRYVEIKQSQSKMRFEEFDFTFYNRTRLAGLENDLANCYINAVLQVLNYVPTLRAKVLGHLCEREFCITCELSFLCHMLRICPAGQTCQPLNLLRTLRQVPEAAALGLIEGPEELDSRLEANPARRIQSFQRFLLEQIHKEQAALAEPSGKGAGKGGGGSRDAERTTLVEQLFGSMVRTKTRCTHCSFTMTRDLRSFQFDLVYPSKPEGERPTFAALLEQSLLQRGDLRSFCEKERTYQRMQQEREPVSLPQVLVVNTGIQSDAELRWWGVTSFTASPGAKEEPNVAYYGDGWLPHFLELRLGQGGVKAAQGDDAGAFDTPQAGSTTHAVYALSALVALVRQEDEDEGYEEDETTSSKKRRAEGHLVAHVRVDAPYVDPDKDVIATPSAYGKTPGVSPLPGRSRAGSVGAEAAPDGTPMRPVPPVSDGDPAETPSTPAAAAPDEPAGGWLLFNDFSVTSTSAAEVVQLYGKQKVPCMVYYTRVDAPPPPPLPPTATVSDELYKKLTSGAIPLTARFRPLDLQNEFPKAGQVFGIDAEFVALSPPEKEVQPDGTELIIRPSRLGLARVSVVRGTGHAKGTPCIDDYVSAVEPVYDYLTRFSGLVHGDLDPSASKHHIVTLKDAYLKLRYLVDKGVIFCGHGLRKDFRMINIVVPPDQIIDTVELFHFKRQRKLSLRFLAGYLLGVDIQGVTHDSIEDAHVAIQLYGKYQELRDAGKVQDVLLDMYRYGKQNGWEVTPQLLAVSAGSGP